MPWKSWLSTAAAVEFKRPLVQKGFVSPMRAVSDSVQHPDYAWTGRPKPSPK